MPPLLTPKKLGLAAHRRDQAAYDNLPPLLRETIRDLPINFVGFCVYAERELKAKRKTEEQLIKEYKASENSEIGTEVPPLLTPKKLGLAAHRRLYGRALRLPI